MKARGFAVLTALSILALTGCSDDEGHTPAPPPPSIGISASTTSVVANGTNTVAISVTDTGGGPVAVTTTRGTFSTGGQSATVPGASGALTLVTCNASTSTTCAGTAVITATSTTGSATTSVEFGALASVCRTSCAADAGCATLACDLAAGGSGSCSATTPSSCLAGPACTPSPANATTETSCVDGVDNDCDGDIDCDDSACADLACRTGSPTFFCKSGACTDISSGLALEVTPARRRLPAIAGATTSVVVSVTSSGEPAPGMGISIATSAGTLSAATGTTGADGTATFTFTGTATPAVATITASITAIPTIRDQATITMPRLGTFRLTETPVQFPVMGALGSGWNELGFVQVQVVDDVGLPYPDGLPVRFEHRRLGGSTLGEPLLTTGPCLATAGCAAFAGATSSGDGEPDSAGLASASLYSGTVAGTLAVAASTSAGGATRSINLPTVAVIGARASGANFSIVCSPRNVPALAETDCAISLVDAPVTCAAILKDRYNNLLGTSTQVVFASESAAVGQLATTPAYVVGTDPVSQADLGTATQIFNTLGAGLPFDVPVITGEVSVNHGLDGCGARDHNPRDGVVTVVAIADGEEAFFDANGNGQYDVANPAATPPTLGEPFVDQGEPFVDQDDDGAYDPGEWFLDVDGSRAYTLRNGTWDAATKIWTQTVVVYTGAAATLVEDPAATPLAYLGTRWADALTDSCTATPAPTPFALTAVSPTESYWVVASDYNLNFLSTGTTYAVDVKEGASTKVLYQGLESYADRLGFFYRYWPCTTVGGATCSSQCRAPVGGTGAGPCVMTPALSDFSCGLAAPVVLEFDKPDGSLFVEWDVRVPWDVFNFTKIGISEKQVPGSSN